MREFYRASARGLRLAGKIALGLGLLSTALIFLAPLYRKPVPGDEGGLSAIFLYAAIGLIPVGAAFLLLSLCLGRPLGKARAALAILAGLAAFSAMRMWSGPDGSLPSLAVAVLAALLGAFGPDPGPSASPPRIF